jgi:transposase InsO family protein
MSYLKIVSCFIRALLLSQVALAAENLALRQQLAILHRRRPRSKLKNRDRLFWVLLSRLWSNWQSVLVIVKPETVIRWHRQGFKYYWRWKSRSKPGRPKISRELRQLIARMSRENPLWGAPRIQDELRLLGHDLASSTIAKYMKRSGKPPSQAWRSFLTNHSEGIAAVDFFTVPTVFFQVLYVWVVLRHERRRVVHFNVTAHPTSAWVAQQLREAFPFDEAPRYLIRDRDGAYGDAFRRCAQSLGIEEVLSAPQSPWQNPFAERLIGTIRRECLDHLIVINKRHLHRILSSYLDYYHLARCHRSLDHNSPVPRSIEPPEQGHILAISQVGGLHHRYTRAA